MKVDNTVLYLAYLDIYEFYSLLEKHKIESGSWRIEKVEPILVDFTVINDNTAIFESYVFHTQYISYSSMIHILNSIFKTSAKNDMKSNMIQLYSILNILSQIFKNIHHHVNFTT